jgi:hypothetical protein
MTEMTRTQKEDKVASIQVKQRRKLKLPEDFIHEGRTQLLIAFHSCMKRQFATLVASGRGLTPTELRDVARTFAMGWAEALASRGDTVATHYWAINFGNMTMADWWPGNEWKFW